VGPDGIHGDGIKEINGVEVDLSTVVVVGAYLGAQMSAFDAEAALGLIDHLQDGEVNTPYTRRRVVIAGDTAFTITTAGALPEGMTFDAESGQIAGTPVVNGVFAFTVTASAAGLPSITKTYNFAVTAPGEAPPARFAVDAVAEPAQAGDTTGSGLYVSGGLATLTASPAPGFAFLNWTENGRLVSSAARYEFTPTVNRALVANFVPDAAAPPRLSFTRFGADTLVITWPTNRTGFVLQQNAVPESAGWVPVGAATTTAGTNHQVAITPLSGNAFYRAIRP
jgi:hypothetical protein